MNTEVVKSEVEKKGLKPGDVSVLEIVNNKYVQDVIENIGTGYDVSVKVGRKRYVLEMPVVDNEQDFILLTADEYISRYCQDREEFNEKFDY